MSTISQRAYHVLRAGVRTLRSGDFGVDLATVQDGLDLGPFERLGEELAATEDGRHLLRHRPSIDLASIDLGAMRALPAGTLGKEVLLHLEAADLLKDVQLEVSPFTMTPAGTYAKRRWRETHDIRHVLTGLDTSIRDEIVLQAFQLGHFYNRFAVVQMAVGPVLGRCPPRALLQDYRRAFALGRGARRLIGVRWEQMWAVPLSHLRKKLNLPHILGHQGGA